jgi:hypothetical protein
MTKKVPFTDNHWKFLGLFSSLVNLSLISSKLTILFAAKLFTSPIKHTILKGNSNEQISIQKTLHIPTINKSVVVYQYGQSDKKILLVHGWSGRGTQLVK